MAEIFIAAPHCSPSRVNKLKHLFVHRSNPVGSLWASLLWSLRPEKAKAGEETLGGVREC